MAHDHDHDGSLASSIAFFPSPIAPGKRSLTAGLQRRAAGSTPPQAEAEARPRWHDADAVSDRPYIDTLLDPVQRRSDADAVVQRAPTAGPAPEDRGPDVGPPPPPKEKPKAPSKDKPTNIEAKVINLEVKGNRTWVMFNRTSDDGVEVGMAVDLIGPDGTRLHSAIEEVATNGCFANFAGDKDRMRQFKKAVINPGAKAATPPVQRHADGHTGMDESEVHATAARGIGGSGGSLPYLDVIQRAFGPHDVSGIVAHTDAASAGAARAIGASAYAAGDHVAFAGAPDLHTAAHEAAHVVQQRAGVHLKSGVGQVGDPYERHADAVADAVVSGESAAALLSSGPGGGPPTASVQRNPGHHDGELGPAGNPAAGLPKAADVVHVSAPSRDPEPKARAGASAAFAELALTAIPHLGGLLTQIENFKGAYELIKKHPVKELEGQTVQMAPYIRPSFQMQLDGILAYKLATMLIDEVMHMGLPEIDFRTWKHGRPAPGSPLLASVDEGVFAGAPAGQAGTSATGAPGAPPSPDRIRSLVGEITKLSVGQLSREAAKWLQQLLENRFRLVPRSGIGGPGAMHQWHWRGDNFTSHGEAINWGDVGPFPFDQNGYDRDHDKRTSATITWVLGATSVPDGTMAGIPDSISHFTRMRPHSEPTVGLRSYSGGQCGITTKLAHLDELAVSVRQNTPVPNLGTPWGGYRMSFGFQWDRSLTEMECDVLELPNVDFPLITNIRLGTAIPKT